MHAPRVGPRGLQQSSDLVVLHQLDLEQIISAAVQVYRADQGFELLGAGDGVCLISDNSLAVL